MWTSFSGLLLLAFRSLAANRLRTSLTTVAVVLGVGCAMGSLTAIGAIQASLDQAASDAAGRADLEVRALAEQGFPLSAAEAARRLPGVALVAPVVEKRTFLRAESSPGARGFVQLVGLDWQVESAVRRLTLNAGRWPDPGETAVALIDSWAAQQGLRLGSQVELITREGFRAFDVVGLVADAGLARQSFGRVAFVSLQTAQQSFGMDQRVTDLALRLERPELRESVARQLADVLPVAYTTVQPDEVGRDLRTAADQLGLALLLFGVTALFVGWFLINNTITMAVAEQRRQIGLLRAAGITREQVLSMVLLQALAIGVLGSALGILAGLGLARGIVVWLSGWATLQALDVPPRPLAVAASLGVGIGTAVAAALLPAWRASAISPIAAIRRTESDSSVVPQKGAWLGALGLLVIGCAALLWPLPESVAGAARIGGILLLLSSAGSGVLGLVAPMSALCAAPFRWVIGPEGRLAELNLRRARRRAGLTIVGFTASLALLVALATLGSSAATAGQQRVAGLFPGDVLVVSPVPQPARLLDDFQQLPGVARVSPLRPLSVASGSTWLDAMAVDPAAYAPLLRQLLAAGDPDDAARRLQAGRAVLIPARLSEALGLRLGSTLPLETVDGPLPFSIAGILAASFPSSNQLGALVLSRQDAERLFGLDGFKLLAVAAEPGVSADTLSSSLEPVAERFGMEVVSVDDLRLALRDAVGRLLYLFSGLIGVGVLVAALGVVNTMMVNVAERRREIGVLRALGLTRRQVEAMVLAEAGMMGLIGGLLGVVCGVVLGGLLVMLTRSPDFDPQPVWPAGAAALSVLGAIVVAMLSALPPARAASRVSVGRVAAD